MEGSYLIFFKLFLFCLIQIVTSTEFVPIFMWETNNTPEPIPALHKISEDSFKDSLLELLKKDPFVVIFAEHTLSPEDFAQRNQAGQIAFENFSRLKKSYKVTYRPYVQNPLSAVKQLARKVTEKSVSSLLNNINVPKDTILIVDLNDAKDDEHRFDMLKRHDANIMSIYNELLKQHNNEVLAMYTAHHTSWVALDEIIHRRARSLLAEEETVGAGGKNYTFLKTDDVLFALTGSVLVTTKNKNESISHEKITMSSKRGNSSSGNEYVIMELLGPQLKITTNFTSLGISGYWKLYDMDAELDGEKMINVTDPNVYAPYTFSYHCGNATFNFLDKARISIPGYQVFPTIFTNSTNKTDSFPDSYDCVGFTTVPIWSGLFVTLLLLFILTFGVTMMMDIKTMDRFDDSKGKTIVINASE